MIVRSDPALKKKKRVLVRAEYWSSPAISVPTVTFFPRATTQQQRVGPQSMLTSIYIGVHLHQVRLFFVPARSS